MVLSLIGSIKKVNLKVMIFLMYCRFILEIVVILCYRKVVIDFVD